MQKNWQEIVKPSKMEVNSLTGEFSGEIVVEPLERGYGITIGNALRRVMLSSLRGTAVTSLAIKSTVHEFSAIDGVVEDVTDIVINVKNIAFKADLEGKEKLSIKVKGPTVVKAKDIKPVSGVEIINGEHVICNVTGSQEFEMDLFLETGKGYKVQDRVDNDGKIGEIFVDAFFSPIKKVAYKVDSARIGQDGNYDSLNLDVVTDGSLSPQDAVSLSAKILQEHLNPFVTFDVSQYQDNLAKNDKEEEEFNFDKKLFKKVSSLEFSVRSANCLKEEKIIYVGDLVQKTEAEMLIAPNFGKKSLQEIKSVLKKMDLYLGMEIQGWRPDNVEEISKKLEDHI